MREITITNTGNRHVELEVIEISPAYRADDPEQPYWFFGVGKNKSAKRGEKMRISPHFSGHKKPTSGDKYKWVAEGTYEGTMKVRNKTNNAIYEFKFTVNAYKPSKKS